MCNGSIEFAGFQLDTTFVSNASIIASLYSVMIRLGKRMLNFTMRFPFFYASCFCKRIVVSVTKQPVG